jgi:hypothetical protein
MFFPTRFYFFKSAQLEFLRSLILFFVFFVLSGEASGNVSSFREAHVYHIHLSQIKP